MYYVYILPCTARCSDRTQFRDGQSTNHHTVHTIISTLNSLTMEHGDPSSRQKRTHATHPLTHTCNAPSATKASRYYPTDSCWLAAVHGPNQVESGGEPT